MTSIRINSNAKYIHFMIQAVIFDMDGVIVESERHWPPIEQFFYFDLIPRLMVENYHDLVGKSVYDIYDLFVEKYNLQMALDVYLDKYRGMAKTVYLEKSELLPHFEELCSRLIERKLPLAIASSSPRSWIEMVITRFALTKKFPIVASAEDFDGEGKPSPREYISEPQKCSVQIRFVVLL